MPGSWQINLRIRLIALFFAINLIPLAGALLTVYRHSDDLELLLVNLITTVPLYILVGIGLTLLISGNLARSLKNLAAVLRDVSRGKFETLVRVSSNDEIGYVGDIVNEMIFGLRERGSEAFDMLQAMNTGHPGSLTTVHANSPADAVRRLESMVLMAGLDLPQLAIRDQISSSLDLILQQERLPGGKRKVVSIAEVLFTQDEGWENLRVKTEEIFTFRQEGLDEKGRALGKFQATGYEPRCLEVFRRSGFSVQDALED